MIAELLGVGSILTSVLGGIGQAQQGGAEAEILRQNAAISRENITYARASAAEEARQVRYAGFKTAGQQRASYGRAGLAQSGSVFDVMHDTAVQYELDAQKAIYAGETQARGLSREADLLEYQAKVVKRSAYIGAATSVLAGGIHGISSMYYGRILSQYKPQLA